MLATNRLWIKELFGLDSGTSLQNAKHPLGVIELAFDTESNLLRTDLVLPLRANCEMLKKKTHTSPAFFEQPMRRA